MITFEVWINGQRLTVAGISQISVLSAIVTAVGQLGPDSAGTTCPPNVGARQHRDNDVARSTLTHHRRGHVVRDVALQLDPPARVLLAV